MNSTTEKFSLKFYGQYATDIGGVEMSAGYRGIILEVEGVDWVDLPENNLLLAWPLGCEIKGYRPDMPLEMADRTHVCRLARKIGALLCQM